MRIRMQGIGLAALALIAGCATQPEAPPAPAVVTANLVVQQSCVDKIPDRPAMLAADERRALPPNYRRRVETLEIDRDRLLDHVDALEDVLKRCAKKP